MCPIHLHKEYGKAAVPSAACMPTHHKCATHHACAHGITAECTSVRGTYMLPWPTLAPHLHKEERGHALRHAAGALVEQVQQVGARDELPLRAVMRISEVMSTSTQDTAKCVR